MPHGQWLPGTRALRPLHKASKELSPCARQNCPCPSSYNGQVGEYCGRTCRGYARNAAKPIEDLGTPCGTPVHLTPSEHPQGEGRGDAREKNMGVRFFTVVAPGTMQQGPDDSIWWVEWLDEPGTR